MQINPYSIPTFLSSILILGLGVFAFLKNKSSRLNKKFMLWCFAVFVWLFVYSLCFCTKNEHLAEIFTKIAATAVMFLATLVYDFFVTFIELTHERKFVNLVYICSFILSPLFLFTNYFLSGVNHYYFGFYGKAARLYTVYLIIFYFIIYRSIFLLYSYIKRKRTIPAAKHTQAKYLFAGFFIASFGSVDYLLKYGIEIYPFGYLFMLAWAAITFYAILKHHLLEIEIVIQKSLIYSFLAALVTLCYFLFIIILGSLFQGLVGYKSFIVNLFAIFAIAILFNPLRNRIQRFLDKRFFKGTLESLAQERERLKQELFQAEKLAYVGNLASSVAHEIRNPLTAIKIFVEHLPEKFQEPEFKARFNQLIPREIERIEHVVNQLLDLAKPRQPNFKPLNIINTIDTTLSLLENNLKLKKIEVKKEYSSNEIMISGDEEQLRQVFLNLFLNSLQAMSESGTLSITTSIEYRESSIEKSVSICVKDNGQGISEENLRKLFTPFFTTKKEGVGLGLSITQEIINQHKGSIKVESKVGEGTTFIIGLPQILDCQGYERPTSISKEDRVEISKIFTERFYKVVYFLGIQYVSGLILSLFKETGILPLLENNIISSEEIISKLNFIPNAKFQLEWMLVFLSKYNFLKVVELESIKKYHLGNHYEIDYKKVFNDLIEIDKNIISSCNLMEYVIKEYSHFFKGTKIGFEIIFAKDKMNLWNEYFSNNNSGYVVYNSFGAFGILKWLLNKGGIKFLELGGGSGSATSLLIERLRTANILNKIDEYIFSDISPVFLRLGNRAIMSKVQDNFKYELKKIDFNKPIIEQGIEENYIDVVYGVNTLHIAKDLMKTLKEIFKIIKRGGMLVISECVRADTGDVLLQELIFNLLDDYKNVNLDTDIRTTPGFLPYKQWIKLFEYAGFKNIEIMLNTDGMSHPSDTANKYPILSAVIKGVKD